MSAKHQKHPKLAKPDFGQYARCEIGILGAPCGTIESICLQLYDKLQSNYKTVYIDADHGSNNHASPLSIYKDMISHHRMEHKQRLNEWQQKRALRTYDLALVNSNHFDAQSQLVIINQDKEASLKRKIKRLSNVIGMILDDQDTQPFEWLYEHVDRDCPIYTIRDIDSIRDLIDHSVSIPTIKGLVLAGGQSSRMGIDKSQLIYHQGMTQEEFMLAQLKNCMGQTYLSKRVSQDGLDHAVIADSFIGLGPFGAILSAFRLDPSVAWIVVACDQPLLKTEHIMTLIERRDPSKVATCYYNPETDFPEPLITLWEPKAYPIMLEYLALGNSCPRKVLINSDICLIRVDETSFMKNANTPEERQQVIQTLS